MRYSHLREQVRAARHARGLTQSALAERSGTSRITIARLERGAAQDIRTGTLERICEALGLELTAAPAEAKSTADRLLERERERCRRLERRLWHAKLGLRLLTERRAAANALVRQARAVVDRWERDRLCSSHYVSRWRAMLDGPVERAAASLLEPGEWGDALFQNSPWSGAREPLA